MKLGPVTKLHKRSLENCDVIVAFPMYGQFEAIQKPNFGCMVCKAYIFSNSNLLSYKN